MWFFGLRVSVIIEFGGRLVGLWMGLFEGLMRLGFFIVDGFRFENGFKGEYFCGFG